MAAASAWSLSSVAASPDNADEKTLPRLELQAGRV